MNFMIVPGMLVCNILRISMLYVYMFIVSKALFISSVKMNVRTGGLVESLCYSVIQWV